MAALVRKFVCKILTIVFMIVVLLMVVKRDQINGVLDLHFNTGNVDNTSLYDFNGTFNLKCNAKIFCDKNHSYQSIVQLEHEVESGCYPPFMKTNYKYFFIINMFCIFLIGAVGNILTLFAIPYCYVRYPTKYTLRWNATTILICQLSFCDLAFILLGLPFILVIYFNEGRTFSTWVCWLTATVRKLIEYTDFLTIGMIAFVRMLALRNPLRRQVISKGLTGMLCAFAWAFSFIILIPITFEVNLFGLDWGKIGFNPLHALCNTYSCKTECLGFSSSAFIYTIAFFVPCFLILLAYLVMVPISLYKYIKQSSLLTRLNQDDQLQYVDFCSINKTLWVIVISYVIFTFPYLWIEWFVPGDHTSLAYIIGYNWYCWIFAINFIVYVLVLQDFREMYVLFVNDCLNCLVNLRPCLPNNEEILQQANQGNQYGIDNPVCLFEKHDAHDKPPDYETIFTHSSLTYKLSSSQGSTGKKENKTNFSTPLQRSLSAPNLNHV